jgi:hypothetical protein
MRRNGLLNLHSPKPTDHPKPSHSRHWLAVRTENLPTAALIAIHMTQKGQLQPR